MVAADDDRRLELTPRHHLVEGEPDLGAVAEAEPADAGRQALELDPLPRHVEPGVEMAVGGKQLLHLGIGAVDVLGIARERAPAEGSDAAAEERTDISGDETGEIESVLDAHLLG